jgi:hypothetical protein
VRAARIAVVRTDEVRFCGVDPGAVGASVGRSGFVLSPSAVGVRIGRDVSALGEASRNGRSSDRAAPDGGAVRAVGGPAAPGALGAPAGIRCEDLPGAFDDGAEPGGGDAGRSGSAAA